MALDPKTLQIRDARLRVSHLRHTMKPTLFVSTIVTLCLLTSCSDPAEKVHKSSASAPEKTADKPGSSGKEFAIRSDSTIGFVGSKVTRSHNGGFKSFGGTISVAGGKIVGTPEVKIAMRSLWADDNRLQNHLKSADFFDVEKYPLATFTVNRIEQSGTQHNVTGNLKLHGVEKSISFPAEIHVADTAVTLKAEFAINRRDFNVNYPGMPNDLIRDNVIIKLDVKATPGPAGPADQINL